MNNIYLYLFATNFLVIYNSNDYVLIEVDIVELKNSRHIEITNI